MHSTPGGAPATCAGSWGQRCRPLDGGDERQWLGWLDIVDEQQRRVGDLETLAAAIRKARVHARRASWHGRIEPRTGGARTNLWISESGHPELLVLDSTDPAQIRSIESGIDIQHTLFLVSSKSGTTLEPNILKQYFFERVRSVLGAERAGARFIAVTDPGSKLQQVAERDRFRAIAFGKPSIGGRYSVLSDFGMVPAALMGLDIKTAAGIRRS